MIALADLEGVWTLARVIEDARAGVTGRFEGQSVWRTDGAGLRQEETGLLHYGDGPPMQASRVYLWRQAGTGLEVLFEDGRPFHNLHANGAEDRHLCPPDIYDVVYDFSAWPNWTQRWHVTGPRKDAIIFNQFSPAG